MSNLIFLLIGLLFGAVITCLVISPELKLKDEIIKDYQKAINIHNKRELRLLFITQSTKDYVKDQQIILRKKPIPIDTKIEDDFLIAGRYMAFKDIEKTIKQLEKNSEDLLKD